MREALFVVNPAGSGHFGALRRHCHEFALSHGWQPQVVMSEVGDITVERIQTYLVAPGQKLVFAVGGDGTVRLCAKALAGSGAPLAVVPRGAANLFALALGIPHRVNDALRVGFEGGERVVDIAEADGETFVAMAGIGIDAAVVGGTPRWMKEHLGWMGYAFAAVPHLLARPHQITVHLDGGGPVVRRAQAVVVGNLGLLPGNFSLLGGAVLDDGVLDVGVLEPRGPLGWAHIARQAIFGAGDGQFEHFRARHVVVHARVALPRQVDGDLMPAAVSLEVKVRPRSLTVRVPE